MKLNDQQEQAANHLNGPCLVIAVPGSGKTRLLVERVARMIDGGIPNNRVVCVTFTNKAAEEMKERICERMNTRSPGCFIGTFHRLCVNLLRKFGDRIGYSTNYTIIDSDDQKDLVKQLARQMEKPIEKNEIPIVVKAINDYRENHWTRDTFEQKLVNPDFIAVADAYLKRLKDSNAIDFSGLLSETVRLLDENPDVLKRIQEAFQYVQVDEVQDTNYAQFYLINQFTAKWNNIMMVGDISQSIYKFRGARYQNIKDFLANHPTCVKIELPLNYRSTPQIVAAADKLIKNNSSHMAEKFEAVNPDGEEVRCLVFNNQFEEGDFVGRHIKKLIDSGGWSAKDVAILYRMNSMSEPIERALTGEGIQYVVIGGRSFYDRREVKDCMAMLKFACNPKDGIAFHRVAGLTEGLGDTTIGKIEKIAQDENAPLLEACLRFTDTVKLGKIKSAVEDLINKFSFDAKSLNVRDCLETCIERFKYEEFLEKEYGADAPERMDNIRSLLNAAGKFLADHPTNSIELYLQMVSLMSPSDKKAEGERVSLMSIHAAKGLEFPIVFIVGVEQNILPHGMALEEDPFEGLEEERRLAYVGLTRAKNLLYVTYNRSRRMFGAGGSMFNKKVKPSQFLFESGLLKAHDKVRV
jgi:DNA helicase-2/ATP-dependent DNA helicase PcrA